MVSSPVVVAYFTLIVFAGAFFLLNLTLAVINSKFTEAHNEHANKEQKNTIDATKPMNDDELENE